MAGRIVPVDVFCAPGVNPAAAYHWACYQELEAIKPGNVHIHADGHAMTVADFRRAADLSAPILTDQTLGCGARIEQAVEASVTALGRNINLGIVLLAGPLLCAAERLVAGGDLQMALKAVLDNLTLEDSRAVYGAIRRAAPGGLGRCERHDVEDSPAVPLGAAMAQAAGRDTIARQYVQGFEDIFTRGVGAYRRACERGWSPAWTAAYIYMSFLSSDLDGHIWRRYGVDMAHHVRGRAAQAYRAMETVCDPDDLTSSWLIFDRDLKRDGVNPGSSADLTVAALLTARLQDMLV